jgi:hypothetical protein
VASVGTATFDQADLAERQAILTAEAVSEVTELQAQLTGGPRDRSSNSRSTVSTRASPTSRRWRPSR